jgi:hypothetical protein
MPEKNYVRTWEELMMDRITQAFHAKDQESPELFDSVIEEIEMLLKLVPSMDTEYKAIKEHKITLIKEGVEKVKQKITVCPDDITKEFVFRREISILDWDYRKDILDTVITLMGAYQKIPFTYEERTEISAVKPEGEEGKEEEDIQEITEEYKRPEPVKKPQTFKVSQNAK